MNYDKLSRSLRYYYEKGIMQKVGLRSQHGHEAWEGRVQRVTREGQVLGGGADSQQVFEDRTCKSQGSPVKAKQ